MIPISRRVRQVEQEDDIPTRLAHLRAEQRNRPRTIFTANSTVSSPSRTTAYLLSDLATQLVDRTTPVVGLPPSWAQSKPKRNETLNNQTGIATRRRLLRPLSTTVIETASPSFPTLSESILRLISRDLANPTSMYREYLSWIPHHTRIRLLDIAAIMAPLNEVSLFAILAVEKNKVNFHVEWTDEGSAGEGEDTDLLRKTEDAPGWEELHDRIDFHSLSSSTIYPFFLTSLNLSFSKLTIESLKSVLLIPLSLTTANRSIYISLFPHLEILKLASMPNIKFDQSLFDLLSSLLRLQHLNLAANLPPPSSQSSPLAKLVLATPHLLSIDLSEMYWVEELLGSIDLSVKWRDLKRMGLRQDVSSFGRKPRRRGVEEEDSQVRKMRRTRWIEIIE